MTLAFIDQLRIALKGSRVTDVRSGSHEGVPVCEILYEDTLGRVKMIALVPKKVGNSFLDTFDEDAYVTEPRPVKKDTPA